MKILVTGAAGFPDATVANTLTEDGVEFSSFFKGVLKKRLK